MVLSIRTEASTLMPCIGSISKLKDLQDFEDLSMNTDRLDDFVLQFQKNADGAQEGNLQEVSLNADTRWVVKA